MTTPTLLVLAAGIGSRYGGLKQIDPVGPSGETIIDYSVYDAIRAGFGKLVFVIRHAIEDDFKKLVASRIENKIAIEYAFQEMDVVPRWFTVPEARKKPWGTGHAVLVARDVIREPFGVINADDFYGSNSLRILAEELRKASDKSGVGDYSMVGYILGNTLSEHGSVARGVCISGNDGYLKDITERTGIARNESGISCVDDKGATVNLTGNEIVSMNTWGFTPSIFDRLQEHFEAFLKQRGQEEKAEFYLSSMVNDLIVEKQARVKVLKTSDSWFGVTYPQDKPSVTASIRALVDKGIYPSPLWR
jgi:UTP-glucose-1-phosphate uridylyltransferase